MDEDLEIDDVNHPLWEPASKQMVPVIDLPPDASREFTHDELESFFGRLAEGYGATEIGLSLGWSPAKIKRFVSDDERLQIMSAIEEREHETMERALRRVGKAGNVTALKFYLTNKAAHRGWSDTRHVKVDARSQQELVISVRQAMDEKTRELVESSGEAGVAALQAAFIDDDDVVDAEIVE